MAEAIGVGLGAASFIFQLTDECIKLYHYFAEASRMPESLRYLRVRLQMEQQRFVGFAWEAGLLFSDGVLCTALQLNQALLEKVLVEIKVLMEACEKTQQKYDDGESVNGLDWHDRGEPQADILGLLRIGRPQTADLLAPMHHRQHRRASSWESISTQASDKFRKLRIIFTDRKRLTWAAGDQQSLETLITKLRDLNSFLISHLDASQVLRLEKAMDKSYLEMLQLRDDVKNLKVLIEALAPGVRGLDESPLSASTCETLVHNSPTTKTRIESSELIKRLKLRELTTIKLDRLRVDDIINQDSAEGAATSSLINISLLEKSFTKRSDGRRILPESRELLTWEDNLIWIEWMTQPSSHAMTRHKVDGTEARIALLSSLLRKPLPVEFRSPACLGYTKTLRERMPLLGIIFEVPYSQMKRPSRIHSLRDFLGERPKPALSQRISLCSSLADCLNSYHCVNWLHKGIRSDNIILPATEGFGYPDLNQYYVAGFELSRPDTESELTVKPETDLLRDLYRHPGAQSGEEDNPYRKSYDMYSLGVVMLEVILWKPIEDILQMWPSTIKRSVVRKVKEQLLGVGEGHNSRAEDSLMRPDSPYLAKAAAKGGDVLREVIEVCLRADELESPVDTEEPTMVAGQRLSVVFDEQVQERLHIMKKAIVLSAD